ncbi:MAG TPA: NADP-dependent oxidoreductase [Bryobacteraceae bacterium]|nr:NADP-dependent oxidoreductase [Bryobacteraceae bacterium]
MRLTDSPGAPVLIEDNAPQPEPGPGELLISVHAAGVTPTELLWYPTKHAKDGAERSRVIPGHEFSGIISATGEETAGFDIGQQVFGLNDWFSDGAMAEYCITQPSAVALKPPGLTHVEAASVPIGGLTAWQGLFDRAKLRAGERVLVHGAAGAVGVFAVQLARYHGARVIATASARNMEFVTHLGAEQVIDYQKTRFEVEVRDVDVVFDTVGGETLSRSWSVIKPSGRVVTIAADSEKQTDERVKQAFFIVEPNQRQLVRIGDLLEAGHLQPVVDTVVPLSESTAAFQGKIPERRGRGKVVVAVVAQGTTNMPGLRGPQR